MQCRTAFFLSALMVGCGLGAVAQEGQPQKPPLAITVSMPALSFKLGAPVPLKLTVTNTSDSQLFFWGGLVHGPAYQAALRAMDIQVRDSGGVLVPETEYGKTIHARSLAAPQAPQYDSTGKGRPSFGPQGGAIGALLKPGESLTEESDLSREFEFSKSGTYIVQALRNTVLAPPGDKNPDAGRPVLSNKLTFTIMP